LERSGNVCDDADFKRLLLRATGHGPEWNLEASGKGLVLEREGQPPLAVPFVGEQLGDGRFNLGTDANGRSEEHTSELQSLMRSSYAVFCLTKKITKLPN